MLAINYNKPIISSSQMQPPPAHPRPHISPTHPQHSLQVTGRRRPCPCARFKRKAGRKEARFEAGVWQDMQGLSYLVRNSLEVVGIYIFYYCSSHFEMILKYSNQLQTKIYLFCMHNDHIYKSSFQAQQENKVKLRMQRNPIQRQNTQKFIATGQAIGGCKICKFRSAINRFYQSYIAMLATRAVGRLRRFYYSLINKLMPFRGARWGTTCVLVVTYVETVQAVSLDIVTYLIGFYLLQLLIGYFTPKGVREEEEETDLGAEEEGLYSDSFAGQLDQQSAEEEAGLSLQHADDKPLARSLGEMEVWERATFAFVLGLACTYFKMVQVDVFWPLLLVYLVVLACYTIQKILKTMEKHRYGLADFSKMAL